MNKNYWSEIAVLISGIGSAIFFVLNLEPFKTLFAYITGATITIFFQRRLQNEAEKRRKNTEYVETYYGPLLITLQEIRKSLFEEALLRNIQIMTLKEFQWKPQIFTMDEKLRSTFITIINDVDRANEELLHYTRKIKEIINEKGNKYLEKPPSGSLRFNPDTSYSPIHLRYSHNAERITESLETCIILDKEPVEAIKQRIRDFHEEDLSVEFYLEVGYVPSGSGLKIDEKRYSERKAVLNKIITEVKSELAQDKGYNDFKSHLELLRKKLQGFSSHLEPHVQKYVSIVD